MNYKVIQDEKLFRDFIQWLPELQPHEKYYGCLFCRSKYLKDAEGKNTFPHIKTDKAQLKRFVSNKDRLYEKVKQLEVEVGAYLQGGKPIPQEGLALYISVNPRDMYKASINTMVKLAQSIRDQNVLMNPHQEALSEIQRTKSRTVYVDFDVDDTSEERINSLHKEISEYINLDAVTFLRTKGGMHLLVDTKKIEKQFVKSFYMNLAKISDQSGDTMIPVPGCVQGTHIPHFIKL